MAVLETIVRVLVKKNVYLVILDIIWTQINVYRMFALVRMELLILIVIPTQLKNVVTVILGSCLMQCFRAFQNQLATIMNLDG